MMTNTSLYSRKDAPDGVTVVEQENANVSKPLPNQRQKAQYCTAYNTPLGTYVLPDQSFKLNEMLLWLGTGVKWV